MTTRFYLIRGNALVANLDAGASDVIALPLLCGSTALSLLNEQHAQNLMANLDLSAAEALAALGLEDHRGDLIKAVILGPDISGTTPWPVYHLVSINNYVLYEVDSTIEDLLSIHAAMWKLVPIEALGLLAIVQEFGVSFYPAAVRSNTGMTIPEALARRDRIAAYLENQGHTDTATLRAATTEHAQMAGIVEALGHTMAQLWEAMVDV